MNRMEKITFLSLFMIAACGTIINGSSQDMAFDSNIQGVEIYIKGTSKNPLKIRSKCSAGIEIATFATTLSKHR